MQSHIAKSKTVHRSDPGLFPYHRPLQFTLERASSTYEGTNVIDKDLTPARLFYRNDLEVSETIRGPLCPTQGLPGYLFTGIDRVNFDRQMALAMALFRRRSLLHDAHAAEFLEQKIDKC